MELKIVFQSAGNFPLHFDVTDDGIGINYIHLMDKESMEQKSFK